MKKTLLIMSVVFTGISASAQVKKAAAETPAPVTKSQKLKAQYAQEKATNPTRYKQMVEMNERPKLNAAGEIVAPKH